MEKTNIRRTAILVDGGYYRKRCTDLWGQKSAKDRANELYKYCMLHISQPNEPRDLYRIFYYDCPPMQRTITHPFDDSEIDYSSMPGTLWSKNFHKALAEKRKMAMRMGELAESTAQFVLKADKVTSLLKNEISISDLRKDDFLLDVKQKGVDMRIGLDVASMANGQYVDQIILIAGDSDFLPVAKMARRNGIEFIIDPMKQQLKRNLQLHVDGIESEVDYM